MHWEYAQSMHSTLFRRYKAAPVVALSRHARLIPDQAGNMSRHRLTSSRVVPTVRSTNNKVNKENMKGVQLCHAQKCMDMHVKRNCTGLAYGIALDHQLGCLWFFDLFIAMIPGHRESIELSV
jgi:hypothetical protein